jgi:hypothetical protein
VQRYWISQICFSKLWQHRFWLGACKRYGAQMRGDIEQSLCTWFL